VKKCVGIIGSASSNISCNLQDVAMDIGKLVVDSGFRIVNGGMGGVMEYSAKGGHQSSCYRSGDVIGILPSYKKTDANSYIDVVIPTGLGVARNALVVSTSDIVIGLDGGAGTLSELAMAWQMKKTIVCYGKEGWHCKLKELTLDDREREGVHVFDDLDKLASFLNMWADTNTEFSGIKPSKKRVSKEDAIKEIEQHIGKALTGDSVVLGQGKEGVVIRHYQMVYKLFHKCDDYILLLAMLRKVSERLSEDKGCKPVPSFSVRFHESFLVSYSDISMKCYKKSSRSEWVCLMQRIKKYDLCVTNVTIDNVKLLSNGKLIFIDIGRDVLLYDEGLFRDSCLQAFCIWMCESSHVAPKVFHHENELALYLGMQEVIVRDNFKSFYLEVMDG